jgi:hypothetical protein
VNAARRKLLRAPEVVDVIRVAAVDDDVSRREMRQKVPDGRVPTAAGIISQTARGGSSFFTRSAIDEAPTALACTNSSTACGDLSKTTHRWPSASRR